MTMNSLSQQRQDQHDEVERLTEAYKAAGGTINKTKDRLNFICSACGHRRCGSIKYFVSFGQACSRCGARTYAPPETE
jgi:hypothetical protein